MKNLTCAPLAIALALAVAPAAAQEPAQVYDAELAARVGADDNGMRGYVLARDAPEAREEAVLNRVKASDAIVRSLGPNDAESPPCWRLHTSSSRRQRAGPCQ